jgi:hypothetical protein
MYVMSTSDRWQSITCGRPKLSSRVRCVDNCLSLNECENGRCFRCVSCQASLAGKPFFESGGLPMCQSCCQQQQ